MALAVGTHFGPYEVLGSLGSGGMGVVYRARDTRLKREVALKVLPESFASDPERLARFQREAEVLASLNHPNIAAIHGLEDRDLSTGQGHGTLRALVLELVEGPTLADIIAGSGLLAMASGQNSGLSEGPGPRAQSRRGLPIDEALSIARQIAEALEAAHERGIVHRDLKPANIKVRDDGTVKVLDFGLAKAMDSGLGTGDPGLGDRGFERATQAPTITTPAQMTGIGVVLGTAAYMAPEQAKGRAVDKRADIWAFGCVLFEMLTGRQPFSGETVTETLAEIMKSEPPWEVLPANVPASALLVLRRCLEKDPTTRMRDIGDVRLALAGAFASPARSTETPPPVSALHVGWRRAAVIGIGALLVGALASGFAVHRLTAPSPGVPTRFTISFPGGALIALGAPRLSVSPDGRTVVYGGLGGLYRRSMADLNEAPIPGTESGVDPTFSPDGQWITFGRTPGDVFKVPISGGTAIPIARGQIRGTSWAGEDSLVLGWVGGGLSRVSANGGEPAPLTTLMAGEIAHRWPQVLPDMQSVVFTVWNGALESSQIAVASLSGGGHRVLLDGMYARYSPGGHLVFARGGSLWAVPFDAQRLELNGTPVPVLPDMPMTSDAAVQIAIARDGTLVYDALDTRQPPRTLAWVDRQGRETPIPAPGRTYLYPRLSPDGRRLAVIADDEEQALWVWDLSRATLMRATFGPARELFPLWTPDGRRIIFGSGAGARSIYWRSADGTGAVDRLTESRYSQNPTAITPDGRFVIFTEQVPDGGDIMQMALGSDGALAGVGAPRRDGPVAVRTVTPLVQTTSTERNAALSPDGRWLAYEANESGEFEVYVRPYPDVNEGRWQVSTDGGARPVWSKNGAELFFVSPAGAVMRVGVERAASWVATTPAVVIEPGYLTNPTNNFGAMFDVTPDGQRFVMIKQLGATPETAPPVSVVVVQHWAEELKRLAPAGR